ncbi:MULTISPECIES: hypothetical protein [unclassified Streptomyces]|uniref:hypothetical protein n=1 Tax=unclassified Streptomyces TaxID=2593676 RepID=UPI0003A4475D|nr:MULTISPECIES: hypothetical protein [unclassified Streptomyces]MYY03330.1 hypothetical protein [Streptomyces sp. SID4913]
MPHNAPSTPRPCPSSPAPLSSAPLVRPARLDTTLADTLAPGTPDLHERVRALGPLIDNHDTAST